MVVATPIFRLGSVAHGKVKVPRRTKSHLTFLVFLTILAALVLGFMQEETTPVGVRVVGDFLMQDIVYRRAYIYIIFVALAAATVLEQTFKIVQVLFQIGFLLGLDFVLLGVVQNDVQAIGSAETFSINGATASATGIGARLVKRPNVATGKAVASNIRFFEFAHVHAVLAAFNLFDQHVHATVYTVNVQVKMLRAGAIAARLPKEPMGKRVTEHTLVDIGAVENPVIGRRQPEQAYIHAFALFVANLYAIARLREHGRR